jgi:DNA-directed RNA polymerase omega subunit
MGFVPVEKLTDVVENKYEAVLIAARDARILNSIARLKETNPDEEPDKVTSEALGRLIDGEVQYYYAEPEEAPAETDEGEAKEEKSE